jgi:hypothetical protein
MEKRALQIAVGVLAAIPVVAGAAGVLGGVRFIGGAVEIGTAADSHLRYLSGLLLAIGVAFWSTVPRIEAKGPRFRLLTAIVFAGGIGRLAALILSGSPGAAMLGGLVMELVVTPLLALWQRRVAA